MVRSVLFVQFAQFTIVGVDDRILILDADSEEARLASKDELKGDK